MDTGVKNFLYRHPELFDYLWQERLSERPAMCQELFRAFLPGSPSSLLEIGCGTGRDLEELAEKYDYTGIDVLPEMVARARAARPSMRIEEADMRTARLGRTFDALLSFGSVLNYALTDDDVDKTLETFRVHTHPGSLLALGLLNGAGFLGTETFDGFFVRGRFGDTQRFEVRLPDATVVCEMKLHFDRRRQRLIRDRTWHLPGRATEVDYCEFRLFFPAELTRLLRDKGFQVVGLFDNMRLETTDLTAFNLFVVAIRQPDDGSSKITREDP